MSEKQYELTTEYVMALETWCDEHSTTPMALSQRAGLPAWELSDAVNAVKVGQRGFVSINTVDRALQLGRAGAVAYYGVQIAAGVALVFAGA